MPIGFSETADSPVSLLPTNHLIIPHICSGHPKPNTSSPDTCFLLSVCWVLTTFSMCLYCEIISTRNYTLAALFVFLNGIWTFHMSMYTHFMCTSHYKYLQMYIYVHKLPHCPAHKLCSNKLTTIFHPNLAGPRNQCIELLFSSS